MKTLRRRKSMGHLKSSPSKKMRADKCVVLTGILKHAESNKKINAKVFARMERMERMEKAFLLENEYNIIGLE